MGMLVGRYRLEELLNCGGMGEIWRAYDVVLGRPVALKLLHPGLTDPTDHERFAREAHAAAQLNHPNIVGVFDVGDWNGRSFLVMELLEGCSLADELSERGPLPVAEVCWLAGQAAAGLAAAHSAGVVHRDIKPSNLVRTRDGTVKLVDFGIARLLDEISVSLTTTGILVGTASYISPEQVQGHSADERSDLYALGCVMYELLCGRPPFVGGLPEVMYAHVHTEPDPPSWTRAGIPAGLDALVLALLAKDPSARPHGAASVRTTLAALHTGGQSRTLPLEPRPAFADPTWWGRRLVLSIAGLVTAAAVAIALVEWSTPPAEIPAAGDQPDPSGMASATPTPTQTPPVEDAAPGSLAWLRQLDTVLAGLATVGVIDDKVAENLQEEVDDVRDENAEGKPSKVRKELDDLNREFAEAVREGKLPANGPISTFLSDLGPPPTDDEDRGRNDDE
jgi:tRNA A-37 threonylcarbamoyl transferase component Bud32